MKKLLLIAVLLFSGLAHGLVVAPTPLTDNVFYVSIASKGGNNANPCTKTRPCLTVAGAAAKVTKPGSIIHVNTKQGDFVETTFSSFAVGVSLECDGVNTGKITTNAALDPMLRFYSSVEGTQGNQYIKGCKITGNNGVAISAIRVNARSNVKIIDSYIGEFDDNGVNFHGVDTFAATGARWPPRSKWASGNAFINSTCEKASKYAGYGRGCLQFGGQEGFLVERSTIRCDHLAEPNNGYCIKFLNGGFNKGSKFFHNTITRASPTQTPLSPFDFAIEFFHDLGGFEFAYNNIQGAIDFGGGGTKGKYGYQYYIHDNVFSYPSIPTKTVVCGVSVEDTSEYGYIVSNKFTNIAYAYCSNFNRNTSQSHIYLLNNVVKNGSLGGRDTSNAPYAGNSINNWHAVHNTIDCGGVDDGIYTPAHGQVSVVTVRNNSITNCARTPILISNLGVAGLSLDGLSVENNNMFNNTNGGGCPTGANQPCYKLFNSAIYEMPLTNLTQQNNISADPLYINASTGDYQLQSGSPNIDIGVGDTNVRTGFDGYDRNVKPDIGAYEYYNPN